MSRPPEHDVVRKAFWSGLLAGVSALTAIVSRRLAATIWRRTFKEEPPE
jgi:hypothetical protein